MEFDVTRKYYEKVDYKPVIFYAVFGNIEGKVEISKDKHHVDGMPKGIEINAYSQKDNEDYFKGIFGGSLGMVLCDSNKELYDKAREAVNCVVVRGNVEDAETFGYMKDLIGIVEAFAENNSVAILDLLNMTFISPAEWRYMYFEKEIDPKKHVNIFVSDDDDNTYWFHTRGLAKFGRPDLSLHKIKKEEIDKMKSVLDLLIDYEGHGAYFKDEVKVVTPEGETYVIKTEFVDDFHNPDFNNAYFNLDIKDVF